MVRSKCKGLVRPESPKTLVVNWLQALFPNCTQIKTIEQFKITFSIKSKMFMKPINTGNISGIKN
tara:strand:- start:4509 stop:4703 length:195 start_codon:yes stop_codon:yes gene_type:complete